MRDSRINNIRAIAIIIVVLGHSIIMYSPSWSLYIGEPYYPIIDYAKRIIDLIQMPLFFSLSGYLFCLSAEKKKGYLTFIASKAKRLLIPYVIIALVWMIPIKLLANYPNYKNKSVWSIIWNGIVCGKDNGHLWFLLSLFIIFVFMYALYMIIKNRTAFIIVAGLLVAVAFVLSNKLSSIPILKSVAEFAIWFFVGYLINLYINSIRSLLANKKILKAFILVICLVMIVVGVIYQNRYVVFAAGLILVNAFYLFIPDKKNKVGEFLSKNAYGIYLFQSPLIYLTLYYMKSMNPAITIFVNFFVFGGLSLAITLVLRKIKLGFVIGEKVRFSHKE